MSISICINNETDYHPNFDISSFITSATTQKKIKTASFEITFIDDTMMTDLHKKHLNRPTSTDIVTFNLNTEIEPEGDIYICIDEAKRNSKIHNISLETEIKTLILHGILHCIGFTDQSKKEQKIMFDEQERLLQLINSYK
tara:strand:- start:1563 stop:1985 length:423 start_codon:yes stop_codon:yes gene_type:complete